MVPNFPISAWRFAVASLLALGLLASGCQKNKNKVSSAQAVLDTINAKLNFTAGDGQVGVRRQTLPTAFTVKAVNDSGQPYGNAPLVICLLDVTGIDKTALDAKALFTACEAGQTSISQVPYADDADAGENGPKVRQQAEDLVGRYVEWPGVADADGNATFKVVTPNKADRVIATVVYLSDKRDADHLAAATFSTALFGQGEHFVLDSTNHNSEAAGANFNLSILVEDSDGYVVPNFNGAADVQITYTGEPSWTGKKSKMPEGLISCAFVQGRCDISGGPWFIAPSGKTTLTLEEHMLNGPPVAVPFTVRPNAPSAIVVASKAGGPKKGAVTLSETELDLEQSLEVSAAIIDDGGNYLGDDDTALWTVSDAALDDTLPVGAKANFTFYSSKAGSGLLTPVNKTIAKSIPLAVKVRSGVQDSWIVTTEHQQTESAGECFDLEVRAADVNGNTVFDVDGAVELTLRLEGVTESGPAVSDTAHFVSQGRNFDRIANITALFTKGLAHLSTQACLYDASAVSPVISVANRVGSQPIEGRVNVAVVAGKPTQLVLSSKPYGQNGDNYCDPGSDTIEKPCINFTTDDSGSRAYVLVADKGGNALSATASSWVATGPVATSVDHLDFPAYATLNLTTPGKGRIDVSNAAGLKLSRHYEIKHGAPAVYQVASQNSNFESSDAAFAVKVVAFDQYNNACTGFDGTKSAAITLIDALPSPAPKFHQPAISVIEPLVFSAGVALSAGKLQAVYASSQPGVTAPLKPYIRTTIDGHSFDSQKLNITAAAPTYSALMTNAGGQGIVIKAPLFLHVNSAFTVYVAGFDVHGNYSRDEFSNFVVTGSLTDSPANLSNASGTTAVLVPSATGVATFTANPTTSGLAPLVINPINVTSSTAENFAIETSNAESELAGVPFSITIRARDRQLNIASSYAGQKTLNFVSNSSTSWAGTSSTLPSGSLLCTFVAGECTLSTNGVPNDYVIADATAGRTTVITVRDQSNEIAGSYAATIDTAVGAPARVVIADKIGGPAAGAVVLYQNRTLTADQSLQLAAAVTDAAGNYLSDATANWNGTVAEIDAGLSATTGTNITFNAGQVGVGMIQASLSAMTEGSTGTITVVPGVPATVKLEAGTNQVVTAGEAFAFTLKIIDADGNVCTSINQAINTHFVWENSSSMPAPGAGPGIFFDPTADWQYWTQLPTTDSGTPYRLLFADELISVVDGVDATNSRMQAMLFDATNVAPRLHLDMDPVGTFPGLNIRTNTLSVLKGPATHVSFTKSAGGSAPSICNRLVTFGTSQVPLTESEKPWAIYPFVHGATETGAWKSLVQGATDELLPCYQALAGGSPVTVFAEARDDGENFVSTATGTWSFVDYGTTPPDNLGGMQADLSTTSGSSTVYTPRIATMAGTSSPSVHSVLLKFDSVNPSNLIGLAPFTIMGGPATNFAQETLQIFTDQPAYLQAKLTDAFGNPGYMLQSNIIPTYSWNGATPSSSPKGTAPVIFPTGATFPNLLISSPVAGQYYGFWSNPGLLPKANEVLDVNVTLGGLGTKVFSIATSAGDGVALKVLDSPNAGGQPIVSNPSYSIDSLPTFYAGLWDSEQNYVGSWKANFSVGGAFVGKTTSPTNVSLLSFSPPTVGTGTISATPVPATAIGRKTTNPLSSVNLGLVTVALGSIDHFEVVTSHGGTESAGSSFGLIVRAKDSLNNTLTGYNSTLSLTFNVTPGGVNAENMGQTLDGIGTFPMIGSYAFNNGELTIPAVFKNSLSAQTVLVSSAGIAGQSTPITVTAGSLDHYGVKLPQTNYSPRADRATTFSAIVEPRDQYGNLIAAGEAGVNLTLVKSDGSTATGTFSGNGTGAGSLDLSSGWVQVNDLAWDADGLYRVKASKAGGKTTPVGTGSVASTILHSDATLATIDKYSVTVSNPSQTAGSSFTITIKALDKSGTKIGSIDALLTPLLYTWTGAGTAPLGQSPSIATPSVLPWSGGQALLDATLFKAEALAIGQLQLVDNASPQKAGQNSALLTINPAALATYTITSNQATRNASDTSLFNLTIASKDTYGNPRPGESGVAIVPVSVPADPANPGSLHGAVTNVNLSTGNSTTISNLYYLVPHQTKFAVSGTSASSSSVQMSFTAVPATVVGYQVSGSGSITAGLNNSAITVTAIDEGGNAITTIDSTLNGYTFTWSGANDAPTQAKSYGTLSAFVSGSATTTHSLYNAESINLTATDNYSPTPRTGQLALTVAPKAASAFALSTATASLVAGSTFDVTVKAMDSYGNVDTNYTSASLQFQWVNATASLANVTNPSVLPSGTRSFTNGVFQSSSVTANAFGLYNSNNSNVALSLVSPALTTPNLAFSLSPGAKASLKIQTGALYTSSVLGSSTNVVSTDSPYTYYTHAYDSYGNWIGLEKADWTNTGTWVLCWYSCTNWAYSPRIDTTSTVFQPVHAGTADLIATSHATPALTKTVTVNVSSGPPTQYLVEILGGPSSFTAGSPFTIEIQALDAQGNYSTAYNGSKTLTFSIPGVQSSPAPALTPPDVPASQSVNFTNGYATVSGFTVYRAPSAGLQVKVDGDLASGYSPSRNTLPGAGYRYRLSGSTTRVAGAPFNMTVAAYDQWDNDATGYNSTATLSFTWQNFNPTYQGALNPAKPTSYSCTFVSGVCTTTGTPFTLYKIDDSATLTMTGGLGLEAGYTTYPVTGSFTVTAASPITYIKIKDSAASPTLYNAAQTVTSMTSDNNRSFAVHAYDTYGNWVSSPSVTWAGTGALASKVSPTTGSTTILTPTLVGPTGTVTATLASPSLSVATGNIAVTPGLLSTFSVALKDAGGAALAMPVTAGTAFKATVTAYDANNNVTNVGSPYLVRFTLNSTTTGPAPDNKVATYGATCENTNTSHAFDAAGQYTTNACFTLFNKLDSGNVTLTVSDSASTPHTGTSSAITLQTAAASKLYATTSTTTVTAGSLFDVTVKAQDAYGNTVTTNNSAITFAWSAGGGAALENGATAIVPTGLSLSSGVLNATSAFKLVKMTGTNYDGTVTLNVTASGLTAYNITPFTVQAAATKDHLILHTVNTTNTIPSASRVASSYTANLPPTIYAHAYDVYGNWKNLETSNWTAGAYLTGRLGTVASVSSVAVNPPSPGLGSDTVTATSTGTVTNPAASETFSITAGPTASYSVSLLDAGGSALASPVGAGVAFKARIVALDSRLNLASGFPGATPSLTWSWLTAANSPAPTNKVPDGITAGAQSLDASSSWTSGAVLAVYNSTITNGRLQVTDANSKTGTSTPITSVTPGNATNIGINNTSSPVAGVAVTPNITVLLRDDWSNPTNGGCSGQQLTVSCTSAGACDSPGGYGGSVTEPAFGGPYSIGAIGTYTVNAMTLYKAGLQNYTFSACSLSASTNITVTPSTTVNSVYNSLTNSMPVSGSDLTSTSCTSGTNVTCPTIYAYGFDAYGNDMAAGGNNWSCPLWVWADGNTAPFNTAPYNASSFNSSGHASGAITQARHVTGSVQCKVLGTVKSSTTLGLTQVQNRPYGWSCGSWSCSGSVPVATCTVSNNSLYTTSAYTFGGNTGGTTLNTTACDSGVSGIGTNTCNVLVSGVTGQASGSLTVSGTVTGSQTSFATLSNPTAATVQAGAVAPMCP